jgi:23S rRNA pseudouridine1911/1915/1917 synthase
VSAGSIPVDDAALDDVGVDDAALVDDLDDADLDDVVFDDAGLVSSKTTPSTSADRILDLAVPWAGVGRLDVVVTTLTGAVARDRLSRSRLTQLVAEGRVRVDGVVATKASVRLRGGERLHISVPPPAPTTLIAEDVPLTFVYDDDDLCVIDKPAGLVVHPGAGHEHGTVANGMLFRFPDLTIGGEQRPGIVHRLDKDTSGLLLVAKNDEALRGLAAQFAGRTVDKRYVACCLGAPGPVGASVSFVTGHRGADHDRRRFTTKLPPPDGDRVGMVRLAHTDVVTRAVHDGVAVVDVTLHTGRTHQIRAHLADRGHPLLQDALYGGGGSDKRLETGVVRDAVQRLTRQALHAGFVSFLHPRTGLRLTLQAPPPPDLADVIAAVVTGASVPRPTGRTRR